MANSNGKYLNGIFIEQKDGNYGPYLSIGISEEGLKALQDLPKSPKGFVNFTASPQKENPNKFSSKPYVPKNNAGDSNETDLPF